MHVIKINKQEIVTGVFIMLCLLGYAFFPASGYFQYKTVAVFFLIVLPFLYNKYFLKRENLFNRIKVGDWKNNLKFLVMALVGVFLIAAIVFKYTDLLQHYLLSPAVKGDFGKFLWYEFTGVAFTVAIYEIFFRGFILFYFKVSLGKWSVLLQFIFFLILMLLFNLPYWFYLTYLIFTPFAGWIAYKSDSILYSFLGQLFFIIIFDASYVALVAK
ncbi:MAG: hypothetical protein HGA36_04855 [Candidatus Moranbacteria bacterium]|nr:hypothetical protein [Candidatus Moranbacteria bacterium]